METSIKYLNLGCGTRYNEDWLNVDFIKTGPGVIPCNLLNGIPFPDSSFDVVYHSHLLEHLKKTSAIAFIKECYRVLKPGGIMRIAVPNLEEIAKEYLKNLNGAVEEDKNAQANYEWITLELFDQMVRDRSGGDMAAYWRQPVIPNEAYVAARLGNEFTSFRQKFKTENALSQEQPRRVTFKHRLIMWIFRDRRTIEYLELGKFRLGGEIHQWMYDRYSLKKLLTSSNFQTIKEVDAFTSMIPDWKKYQWLDVDEGKARKPDSLFMEAMK